MKRETLRLYAVTDQSWLGGNSLSTHMHTDAVGLHHCRLPINVDHESREHITLTMYQAIGVVVGIVGNTDGLTHLQG